MSSRKPTGIEARQRRGRTVYRAVVYDKAAGRKITKTFDTITAAKQWRADAMAAVASGRLSAERGPTLTEAVEQWLAGARAGHIRNRSGDPYKPSAIRAYEQNARLRLLPDLGAVRLADIRHRDLQALVDRLVTEGLSPATVMTTLLPLRAIFRRAHARGVVNENPTRGIEMPAIRSRRDRIASPQEAGKLLGLLDAADRPLWATALYAGLRRGELTALCWSDVDLAAGTIHVRRGWDLVAGEIAPKSREGRRKVPIPAVLRDHLVEHRMRCEGTPDARVFGTPSAIRSASERARRAWADARGVEPLSFHEARHTYASLMIAAGVNAKALSTYMGHANIAITYDLYGHLMPGNEAEAAGLLDAYIAREVGGTKAPDPDPTSPDTSPETAKALS